MQVLVDGKVILYHSPLSSDMDITLTITSGPLISTETLERFGKVAKGKGKTADQFLAELITGAVHTKTTRKAKGARKP